MSGSSKKPRKKVDVRRADEASSEGPKRKEADWSFDDIARSKTRRR